MKSDLTLPEVRAAFMAQYFPQHVLRYVGAPLGVENWKLATSDKKMFDWGISRSYLLLRPISSLTEEEKTEIENLEDITIDWTSEDLANTEYGYRIGNVAHIGTFNPESIDFLRSIGILIPYRGNSSEELIKSGLAVYRKEE